MFDINRYKEEQLLNAANLISAVFLLDRKEPQDVIEKLDKIIVILKGLDEEAFGLFKDWLKHIFKLRFSEDINQKFEKILDEAVPKEVESMVSNLAATLDKMIESAENNGIEKEKVKIAKRLVSMGMNTEIIVKATGLTEQIIG